MAGADDNLKRRLPDDPVTPAGVVVLTLTYGDRIGLLERMAQGVAAEGVTRIMVFCNGLTPDVTQAARNLATRLVDREIVLDLHLSPVNVGSAQGYGTLLAAAAAETWTSAVWLLDDDNVPEPGCLARLLTATARTGGAVTALRRDRAYMLQAVASGGGRPPRNGEAFGRDVRTLPARVLRKLRRGTPGACTNGPATGQPVPMPRVPYGGLLVPVALVRQVAPPRKEFVLYADDYDYTARLAVAAGLHAVPDAFIHDLEASWNATGTSGKTLSQAARLATMPPDFRLYYALRNALRLDRERLGQANWPWFAVNLAILVADIGGRALLAGRPDNLRCILRAATAALRGKLGPDPRYPLPCPNRPAARSPSTAVSSSATGEN